MNEIIRFFCEQDSTWSLCTLPFMMAFIVFFAIYLLLQRSSRTAMMAYVVAFSLFFAYKANGILMVLLPLTALLSWWLTRLMSNAGTKAQQKFLLTLTILIDLAPLCYYKYTNFSISTVNAIFGSNFALQDIFLPVGISFYTFQAISYSIDVYKKKFTLDTSLL